MRTRRSFLQSSSLLALSSCVPQHVSRSSHAGGMNQNARVLVDLERLPVSEWSLTYSLRPRADRESIRVGELVKVALRSPGGSGARLKPAWTTVVSVTPDRPRYLARFIPPHDTPENLGLASADGLLEFGPEHVCRMPARRYVVWGENGIPKVLCDAGEPPYDRQGQPVTGCSPVVQFAAAGWNEALRHYRELAASESNWPAVDQLI
jgi:hypothetical protein